MRRCTQGISLLSLLLFAIALVLDDMAVLLAAATLAFCILGQYLAFDRTMRETVRSVELARTLSRNPVRKGTSLKVTTQISVRVPRRVHVRIFDLLPLQAAFIEGETEIALEPGPEVQTRKISYTIVPVIHGEHPFSGLSVQVRNRFFEATMHLTRKSDQEPVLSVQPSGLFAPPPSEMTDGSLDMRKTSAWSGSDVHSLRDYVTGDDLRHVDWKVSAKYTKLVIRKYTAPQSHPPLVIVDLPWKGAPYPEKAFSLMISEVTGMVRHTVHTYQYISVLIICGPNIVHLIREEKNISRCIAALQERMHPSDRFVHFYHTTDRSDIRSRLREAENRIFDEHGAKTIPYYECLRDQYEQVLDNIRTPAFTGQVSRALSQITFSEAFLFTLEGGDTSHIRHVVRPLRTRNIKVQTRIIRTPPPEPEPAPASSPAAGTGVPS
ncbi:MAG: DUF58 domain-containing protein [Methanoregula sp.]